MNRTTAGLVVAVLVLASLSGFLFMRNISLEQQVSTLTQEKAGLTATVSKLNQEKANLEGVVESQREEISSLNERVSSLNQQIAGLTSQVQALEREKAELQDTVSALNMKVNQLQNEKSNLIARLNQVQSELNNASASYDKWAEFLLSYSTRYLNYTAKRVFSNEELEGLRDLLMNEVISNPKYMLNSFQDIYSWITSNIKYVEDGPFPWPPSFDDFVYGSVKNKVLYDSMMAPSETLALKQGDCDDQAALAYAMIKSYLKYIYGKEYVVWLMYAKFNNLAHAAVAFPMIGAGNQTLLTILDPAGRYLTTDFWGNINAKDPFTELENYKDYWARSGSILETITLYEIENGVAYKVVSGSIHEVASYIASH